MFSLRVCTDYCVCALCTCVYRDRVRGDRALLICISYVDRVVCAVANCITSRKIDPVYSGLRPTRLYTTTRDRWLGVFISPFAVPRIYRVELSWGAKLSALIVFAPRPGPSESSSNFVIGPRCPGFHVLVDWKAHGALHKFATPR